MDMGDELRAIATTLSFPKAVLSYSEDGENSSSEEINALKKDIAKGRKLKSVLFRDEVEDRASQESVSLVVEAKNDIQKYLALYAMLRLGVATGRTIVFVRAVEEALRCDAKPLCLVQRAPRVEDEPAPQLERGPAEDRGRLR